MAVSYYQQHRPREASITVSLSPDFSGDYVADGAADQVEINAAIVEVVALGGGEVVLGYGAWALTATVNVPVDVMLRGVGWETILNYNAGGNCITVTGDNVKIRDLKIIIVAGAGGVGTRPNGIIADTRTNIEIFGVWQIGDTSVADDGNNFRQCGIVFLTVSFSKIINCKITDNDRQGTSFSVVTDSHVSNNIITDNSVRGIFLTGASNNNLLSLNTCRTNGQDAVHLIDSPSFNIITNNICRANLANGIHLATSSNSNIISNNVFQANVASGILFIGSSNNSIVSNYCYENDVNNTGSFDGISIGGNSDDNVILDNICNANDRYGINITADTCNDNWVKNNQLQGNTSGPLNDVGTGTKLTTYSMPFIQGSTLISAAGNPWGWEIDLAAEFAVTWGWLPLEVQQVVRIRVIAVGLAAPGVGAAMRLELTGEGATFDEVYTTHSIDVANHDSEEQNFAIDDVVNWIFDSGDDADIGNLLGGDRVQFKVLYSVAGGGHIQTDAVFSSVEIEYV